VVVCSHHAGERGIHAECECGSAALKGVGPAAGMEPSVNGSDFWRDTAWLWVLALFSLVLHLARSSAFDYYVDELYILQTSKHSLIGYADDFPLQIWLMWLTTSVLGCTPFAIRLFPALAGAANILAAGLLAREVGGRRFAVSVAGLGTFVAPFLAFAATCANAWSYEGLPWTLSGLLIVRILRTGHGRLWWFVGIVWGLGLLMKPTIVLFMAGIGLGFLLTRARAELLRTGYWLALAVSMLVFSPALIWQTMHGWPFLDTMRSMRSDEYAELGIWLGYFSRSKMLLAQPALLGPVNCILAVSGVLFHLVLSDRRNPLRSVLWGCIAAGCGFLRTSGYIYYLNPLYAILLAFGAVAAAQAMPKGRFRWARPALVGALAVQGLVVAPLCVPLLPNESLDRYSAAVCRGMLAPLRWTAAVFQGTDVYRTGTTVCHFAYMSVPTEERNNCCMIIGYAPVAVGMEYYGAEYGLPKIYSPHLNFISWGPPEESTQTVIAQFFSRKELEGWFGSVERFALHNGVYICRQPKKSYREIWQEMCRKDASFRWKENLDDKEE